MYGYDCLWAVSVFQSVKCFDCQLKQKAFWKVPSPYDDFVSFCHVFQPASVKNLSARGSDALAFAGGFSGVYMV